MSDFNEQFIEIEEKSGIDNVLEILEKFQKYIEDINNQLKEFEKEVKEYESKNYYN